jgi:hypothetical protein
MKSGDYKLTRSLFQEVYKNYRPSPKDAVVRELNAFEEAQHRQQELIG